MSLWYWYQRDLKEDQNEYVPDVFSMAEGGSKCTEGGRKPSV